jgi:hypothetical protein
VDQYAIQDLVRRLQHLAIELEAEGRSAKIIRDTIAYISRANT